MIDFVGFPKISRLARECIVTEKIDGTNAQIVITPDGDMFAGSRTRFITPTNDNQGFARWVEGNKQELLRLGPGQHFGEWWGKGIQRGYGMNEKVFSLFNTTRWRDPEIRPKCCRVVPTLWQGTFNTNKVDLAIVFLIRNGSEAAPGFMKPEGVVVFHTASNTTFKQTLENDEVPKGMASRMAI